METGDLRMDSAPNTHSDSELGQLIGVLNVFSKIHILKADKSKLFP